MKVVITGAAGFVGKALLKDLSVAHPDVELCAILRTEASAGVVHRAYPRVRAIPADAPEAEMQAVLKDAHAVVHLAWSSVPLSANKDMDTDLHNNVSGGLRLLEACGRAGIGRFIFLSSGGTVYGSGNGVAHVESAALDPVGAYGTGKACMEHYVQLRAGHLGYRAIVLRPANLYGSASGFKKDQGVVEHWFESLRRGRAIELWNGLDVVRDYVHVRDMIAVIVAAIYQDDFPGTLNVGTGHGTSLERLRDLMFAISGRNVPFVMRGVGLPAVPWNVLDPALLQLTLHERELISIEDGLAREWAAPFSA